MEDTEPMDVDDSSPQGAKEDPNVCNATNREFTDTILKYEVDIGKPISQALLDSICALLNSGGGVLNIKVTGWQNNDKVTSRKMLDEFWSKLEDKLMPIINPSFYHELFDRTINGTDEIFLFVNAPNHWCTMEFNLFTPLDTKKLPATYEKVLKLLKQREKSSSVPQVPIQKLPPLPEPFVLNAVLEIHESKEVQLKRYTSSRGLLHKKNRTQQDEIREWISAFGNGSGGLIVLGVDDETGKITGQLLEGDSKDEVRRKISSIVDKMSQAWCFIPKRGVHWDLKFFPVEKSNSAMTVVVIYIAGMQNLGGIFTKCPRSCELRPGRDGKEEVHQLNFEDWKQQMLCTTRDESKGAREAMQKFRLVNLSSGPLLTLQGSVEEIVEAFFPVEPGCQVVPNGFESNLPEEAKQVIRKIQEQTTNGLLVASSSILSAVQKERQRKEDGVICDLLLLSESLGRLHLISLVSSGSQDQFFPHARATAKAVKKALVRNGGCYEKFYITCQVMLCNRVGTEPLDISSPDSRYPKEYHLSSSPQELVKINKILQSLVIVLAHFPSFLSNKQGLKFLSLLTKEQFELMCKLNHVEEERELWIQGVAGTGKTVVAVEFIRRLRLRYPNLKPENILYVCERPAMLPQIRKLDICECRTRKAFMEESRVEGSFLQIRHVILDEVQNFQAKDGDWLTRARALVKQHIERESTHDDYASGETEQDNSGTNSVVGLDPEGSICQNDVPGYLWCFMDKNQGIFKSKTGIPDPLPQTFILTKVIRNSKRIFDHAEPFLDWLARNSDTKYNERTYSNHYKIAEKYSSFTERGKSVTIGHDFDGELSVEEYSEGERIARLIEVLESLLKEGYSQCDIAVLCFTKPLEGNEREHFFQAFPSTVNAERNDDDNIVLSTVREYGGLERPVVIIVGEPFDYNSKEELFTDRVNYCAYTRAMVKLIILKKKSVGQKRKESN